MLEQRKQLVVDKCVELIRQANTLYGITLPHVEIRFDLRGAVAGYGGHKMRNGVRHYFMRYNIVMMSKQDAWEDMITDTVPHEVAHVVCYFRGNDRGHGWNWYNTCRALGGSGKRTHDLEVEYVGGTYYYTSTTNHVVAVSSHLHTKIQRGRSYSYRNGKGRIHNGCAYTTTKPVEGAPTQPFVPPVQRAPQFTITPIPRPTFALNTQPVTQNTGASKADQVRARIRIAKQNGEGQEQVIWWACQTLGMARSLAKVYVQGNWDKA
jgi:predicted SprT family Zn-dependent metalloprotease